MQRHKAVSTKIITRLPLFIICIFSFLLALPMLNNNINDPNMIFYFNADEGGQMDLIWSYYSGKIRDSFLFDFDYGLEMAYLSDLAKHILSHFIDFTPGTFVLLLRWLHLFAWIGALIALWKFVGYHFGKGWQQSAAVALLAARPAFAYLTMNLKPEPLVLLFMIIGLDHTLRLIEKSSKPSFFIAIACAAIAFIVKFAGIFLLIAIIASLYFSNRYQKSIGKNVFFPQKIRIAWLLPSIMGCMLLSLLGAVIAFYVRKSTGSTWYGQFGFWGSLWQNKSALYLFWVSVFLLFLSPAAWLLAKNKNPAVTRAMGWVNEINSYVFCVLGVFTGFIFLFGFKWVIKPQYFILTYAPLGCITSAGAKLMITEQGLLQSFLKNILARITALDPIICLTILFYLCSEAFFSYRRVNADLLKKYKRLVLVIFLIPAFLFMFSMLKMAQHHMLPFFVAMIILSMQGFIMLKENYNNASQYKRAMLMLFTLLLIIDIGTNAQSLIKQRINTIYKHKRDIAHEIAAWLYENIPLDARIVSDHYQSVCIPYNYKNVRVFNSCTGDDNKNKIDKIRGLISAFNPQFIFYNANGECYSLPPIEEILSDKTLEIVKVFKNKGMDYQVKPNARFVLYSFH